MERYKKTPILKPLAKNQLAQNDSFGCNFVCMRLAEIQNNSRILLLCNARKKKTYMKKQKNPKKSQVHCVLARTPHNTHTVTK